MLLLITVDDTAHVTVLLLLQLTLLLMLMLMLLLMLLLMLRLRYRCCVAVIVAWCSHSSSSRNSCINNGLVGPVAANVAITLLLHYCQRLK